MRSEKDTKAMAKALREELARRGVAVSHGECLDIVARQFGLDNWNVLAARLGETASGNASSSSALSLPDGWAFEGSRLDYEVGVDQEVRHGSGHSAMIRTRFAVSRPDGTEVQSRLGALYQELDAAAYRGKRLRLQADLRTEGVVGAATIWLQVDRNRSRDVLVLDNLEERSVDGPLTGTQGWTTRHVVLDVPAEAVVVHYGFYLRGSGTAWAGDFALREAEAGEAVTKAPVRLLPEPRNLDFSRVATPAH